MNASFWDLAEGERLHRHCEELSNHGDDDHHLIPGDKTTENNFKRIPVDNRSLQNHNPGHSCLVTLI